MKYQHLRERLRALQAGNELAERFNYYRVERSTLFNSIISAGVIITNRQIVEHSVSFQTASNKLYVFLADNLDEIQEKETMVRETIKWYFGRIDAFKENLEEYSLIGMAGFLIPDKLYTGRTFRDINHIKDEFRVSYDTAETRYILSPALISCGNTSK
jgi:hypothetical protein